MSQSTMITCEITPPVAELVLNDPQRRNALGVAMFDALDEALAQLAERAEGQPGGADDVMVLHLRGAGAVFCAGFDLAAAAEDIALLEMFVRRLSRVNRMLRRGRQVVIASVHGAALAGGCALLSACDFVIASAETTLGYPVHRIGLSPAMTIPTLQQAIGSGAMRDLLMSGRLIDAAEAQRLGLVTQVAATPADGHAQAAALAQRIAGHGHHALRVTRQWLNELDGSLDDARFEGPAADSGRAAATSPQTAALLQAFWAQRKAKPGNTQG